MPDTIPTPARRWRALAVLAVVVIGIVALRIASGRRTPPESGPHPGARPVPVRAVAAVRGDIAVRLEALGTVTAYNTVTVRSRVDGELVRVLFDEGQQVRTGQALAEIDPRPFEVALAQAQGELQRDQALLANAEVDLARYRDLLAQDSIAKQQVDGQEALVRQYRGTVLTDEAQVKNAELQLTYAHITAPIDGRVGLRQVDAGNMVHAADAQGLVVLTQTHPISVIFTLPSDELPQIAAALAAGEPPRVTAYDRAGRRALATGTLRTLDNQIDIATGTIKLKADFENRDDRLFPNQFVNVSLTVAVHRDALLAPVEAVQQGAEGPYVYAVTAAHAVTLKKIATGATDAGRVEIVQGLEPGTPLVIDGVDRLHEGAKVEVVAESRPEPGTPNDAATPPVHHGHRPAPQ